MASGQSFGPKVFPLLSRGGPTEGVFGPFVGDDDSNLKTTINWRIRGGTGTRAATANFLNNANGDDINPDIIGPDAPFNAIDVNAFAYTFDEFANSGEGAFNRRRGNTHITALPSAARTVTTSSANLVNHNDRGAHFIINLTAGGPVDIDPFIEAVDETSSVFYTLLTGTNIAALGTVVLKVYPGIAGIVGGSAVDILPRLFRIRLVHNNANSVTYSVGVNLVV